MQTKVTKRNPFITLPQQSADHIEDFIVYKQSVKDISRSTERAYRTYIASWMEAGGADLLSPGREDEIKTLSLRWLAAPLGGEEAITNATWNRNLAYLKAFFSYLITEKKGVLTSNPLSGIHKRHEDRRLLHFGRPEVDRVEKVLYETYMNCPKFVNLRNYIMFLFLASVGTRAGETALIRRRDVDIARGSVLISGATTKTGRSRHVPLPHIDLAKWGKKSVKGKTTFQICLETYYDAHLKLYPDDNTPLFCSTKGSPLTSGAVWHALKPALRAGGIPEARVHDLRHFALTQISLALQGGTAVVQAIAGHTTPVMTARYVNPSSEQVCALAADAIRKAAAS